MYLPKPAESTGFQKCPEGTHLATCYEVIDRGTQETRWGKKRQVWIGWETPNELMDDGRPFVIGDKYTFNSHEKSTLRNHLELWRGKRFSDDEISKFAIESVIGTACLLSVIHKESGDRVYANIASIAALPKGTETPELHNERVFFSLERSEFNEAVFNSLSERMQETIKQSPEYAELAMVGAGETEGDSPF